MREAFRTAHPLIQLGILILLGFGAMFACMVVGIVPFWLATGVGLEVLQNPVAISEGDRQAVFLLKLMQIMQAIGLFMAPFVIYRILTHDRTYSLSVRQAHAPLILLFVLIMLSAFPFINILAEWNNGIKLPESMAGLETWIRNTEAQAEALIKTFLQMETTGDLLFNLLLIALVPAIAEELFFRGLMQPLFLRTFRNATAAIWITAFCFSFFHLQFLGFVPRLILGAVLGYAAHWSGTLWLPIAGHFVNNAAAVLVSWFIGVEALESEFETLGAHREDWVFALGSALLLITGMYLFYRLSQRQSHTAVQEGS